MLFSPSLVLIILVSFFFLLQKCVHMKPKVILMASQRLFEVDVVWKNKNSLYILFFCLNTQLALNVTSLPQLRAGEYYSCLFDDFAKEHAIVDQAVINNSSILRCNTPRISAVPDRPQGNNFVCLFVGKARN